VFPCTDCKKAKYFASKQDLKRHYSCKRKNLLHKVHAKFVCKLCKTRFSKSKDYKKHCSEREFLNFECATCSKKFGCHKLFLDHVREEKKSGFCKICKTNVKSFKRHMDMLHRKHTCDFCKVFETNNYADFNNHAQSCATDDQLQALGHLCTICDTHFRHKRALNKHINTKHAHFWCKKCSRSFNSEYLLKDHTRRHTLVSKLHHYKCILCEPAKNFYMKSYFNSHFQANHGAGSKKFNCDKCKRGKASKAMLTTHFAISTCYSRKTDQNPQRSTRASCNLT
jgi:Zinc finger, C2H2 type